MDFKLSLKTLGEIDNGRLALACDLALTRLLRDLRDRPSLKKARVLTMRVSLSPVPDDAGDLHDVDVAFTFNETLPKRETRAYVMRPTAEGLVFNDVTPRDPRQTTLDQAAEAAEG